MKVAVWDTYVKRPQGDVLHFDIIVPEALTDSTAIYAFGKQHLAAIGEPLGHLDVEQCQFCHVESPGEEALHDIATQGYHIIDLGIVPAELPDSPTRRDMILHLRAHHAQHRFANFQGVSEAAVRELLSAAAATR